MYAKICRYNMCDHDMIHTIMQYQFKKYVDITCVIMT